GGAGLFRGQSADDRRRRPRSRPHSRGDVPIVAARAADFRADRREPPRISGAPGCRSDAASGSRGGRSRRIALAKVVFALESTRNTIFRVLSMVDKSLMGLERLYVPK